MSLADFKKVIQKMVAEEIKKQLPGLVKEALTEQYLRKIVSETRTPKGPAHLHLEELEETLGDEGYEEQIPEPLANSHKGIYNKGPLLSKNESRRNRYGQVLEETNKSVVSALLSPKNNPMAMFLDEKTLSPDPELDPGPKLSINESQVNFMRAIAQQTSPKLESGTSPSLDAGMDPNKKSEWEMRRIELQRQKLDGIKVG